MTKRGREDTSWEKFVSTIRYTIDTKFEEVNTIEAMPLSITIFMPTVSRIKLALFESLKHDNYSSKVAISIETIDGKENISIKVSYVEKKTKFEEEERKDDILFQSPKNYLEQTLHLKDNSTIELVDRTINSVFTNFKTQINWTTCSAYNLIYFKKHNQIIIRFQFKGDTCSFHKQLREDSLKSSWIEYTSRRKRFFLVSVIENCC